MSAPSTPIPMNYGFQYLRQPNLGIIWPKRPSSSQVLGRAQFAPYIKVTPSLGDRALPRRESIQPHSPGMIVRLSVAVLLHARRPEARQTETVKGVLPA